MIWHAVLLRSVRTTPASPAAQARYGGAKERCATPWRRMQRCSTPPGPYSRVQQACLRLRQLRVKGACAASTRHEHRRSAGRCACGSTPAAPQHAPSARWARRTSYNAHASCPPAAAARECSCASAPQSLLHAAAGTCRSSLRSCTSLSAAHTPSCVVRRSLATRQAAPPAPRRAHSADLRVRVRGSAPLIVRNGIMQPRRRAAIGRRGTPHRHRVGMRAAGAAGAGVWSALRGACARAGGPLYGGWLVVPFVANRAADGSDGGRRV
jgi:hypothetical protein